MARFDPMLPRRPMLIVVTATALWIVQGVVEGWTFAKPQTQVILPIDYPLNHPFHRVVAIPEHEDVQKNTTADFIVGKVKFYLQNGGASRALGSHHIVDMEQESGFLRLKHELPSADLTENALRGKFLITVGNAKTNHSRKKTEILLFFNGTLRTFCSPSPFHCFPAPKISFKILENTKNYSMFDSLLNPGIPSLCPNLTFSYQVVSGNESVHVDQSTGDLRINTLLDAEKIKSVVFKLKCSVEGQVASMTGNIAVIDVNDNAPTTQFEKSSAVIRKYLKPGENSLSFAVSALDKDSQEVNHLVSKVEDDSLKLFVAKDVTIYGKLGNVFGGTYANAEIESDGPLSFPGPEYNFTVVIKDLGLPEDKNKVTFTIVVINKTETEFQLNDTYKVNISKMASQYARVIQLSTYAANYKKYQLLKEIGTDWLNITSNHGVVFIQNPLMASNLSSERRTVLWQWSNDTYEKSGSSQLLVNIEASGNSGLNCDATKWCSFYNSQISCETSCGKGSGIGFCSWRVGSLTSSRLRKDYATCSPDLSTCPDGHCDELEQMEPTLCPQDCARKFVGAFVMSRSGRGLESAVGTCSCPSLDRCSCVGHYPPAEIRRIEPTLKLGPSTNIPIVEIDNLTNVDTRKRFQEEELTTPGHITGLLPDNECGLGCIVLASIAPCVLLLIIVMLIIARKIKSNQISKHKFIVGSHISLSAVPSDYVEERSNSAQDSRTTPCDSSGSGKTILDPKWEFPRSRLQLQSVLGEGEFGKVMKAQAWGIGGNKGFTTVAVKMLKENGGEAEKRDLVTEFLLLKEISHPNIVRLLGACTEKGGPFYVIVEYAEMGSLRAYLRKRRRHNNCCQENPTYGVIVPNIDNPTDYYRYPCQRSRSEPRHSYFHKEQLSFAWQIAKGMAYLSSTKLIHRDLATRNILLAKRKVAKISDFGLSRDIYEGETYLKKSKGRVPVKWMAIESLEDQIYTTKSDVWSFGVVMWEILMQGATPYPGVTPQRLYNLLKAGYRMSKPDYCSEEMYQLMRQCWRDQPQERPSFKEIVQKLDYFLQDTVEYMDFNALTSTSSASGSRKTLVSSDPLATVQYTSVLVNEDEEQSSEEESLGNIGLVNLFNQAQLSAGSDNAHKQYRKS